MRGIRRALGFGFLSWLLPFLVSVAIFPLKKSHTPLFDTLMGVVVTAAAVALGCRYLRSGGSTSLPGALAIGCLWLGINILLDLLLFSWGPMQMTLSAYMMDIGLAYLVHPIVLTGLYLTARRAPTEAPSGA